MKTMMEYVEELRAAKNIPSDRQLAFYLGLTKQAVSKWKSAGYTVDPDTAWKIADGLGVDPIEVICASEIERAKRTHNDERLAAWRARLSSVSAGAVMVFSAVALLPDRILTAAQCILC